MQSLSHRLSSSLDGLTKNNEESKDEKADSQFIPCLYLPCELGGNKLIIYFHGNAEDIGLSFDLLSLFGQEMRMHVLVVEYPGYGLYKTAQTCEQIILEDAEIVYDYITTICGVRHSDIILFGRSIGTGPTSYLASRKPCHSALLMSAYTSIKDVAKNLFGWVSFMSWIVAERFPNLEYIK